MVNDVKAATISTAATFLFRNRATFNPADAKRNVLVVSRNQQDINSKTVNKQKAERRENDGQRGQILFFDTINSKSRKQGKGRKQEWETN